MIKLNLCVAADFQSHQLFSVVEEIIQNRLPGFSLTLFLISKSVSSFGYKSEEIPVLPHSASMKVKQDTIRRFQSSLAYGKHSMKFKGDSEGLCYLKSQRLLDGWIYPDTFGYHKLHKRLGSSLPKCFMAPCLTVNGGNYKGSTTLPHNLTLSIGESNRRKNGRREKTFI